MKTQLDRSKLRCRMYDNDTLKWQHEGTHYLLHVRQDETADDPRSWDNVGVMACFHRRYCLGDKVEENTPERWWQANVRQTIPAEEIAEEAIRGNLPGIRIAGCEDPDLVDIYEVCYLADFQTKREAKEYLEYSGVDRRYLAEYLLDDLTIGHCQYLLRNEAYWLALWLYDHSGITMSATQGGNPYSCQWDSGQVGWIYVTRERAMHTLGNITEDNWRERAEEVLRGEVETYDQFLTGEVYGYELYEYEPPEDDEDEIGESSMNEIDSCWGFYGSDIVESGLADNVDCGLLEAISAGIYEEGAATLHHISYYSY